MRQLLRLIIICALYLILSPEEDGRGVVPLRSIAEQSSVLSMGEGEHSQPTVEIGTYSTTEPLYLVLRSNRNLWRVSRTHSVSGSSGIRIAKLRHRTNSISRISLPTSVESRAGHVTRIFDFNLHRSSLRVGYYLYALCRLRI